MDSSNARYYLVSDRLDLGYKSGQTLLGTGHSLQEKIRISAAYAFCCRVRVRNRASTYPPGGIITWIHSTSAVVPVHLHLPAGIHESATRVDMRFRVAPLFEEEQSECVASTVGKCRDEEDHSCIRTPKVLLPEHDRLRQSLLTPVPQDIKCACSIKRLDALLRSTYVE